MKWIPIGQTPFNVIATENEKITVPAGTYDTVVLSYSNSQDRIWIVDDFPFPIKGETWKPGNEPKSKRYQFELLDYKENVMEDPFVPITLLDESFAENSTQVVEMHVCGPVNGTHQCRTENVGITIGKIPEEERLNREFTPFVRIPVPDDLRKVVDSSDPDDLIKLGIVLYNEPKLPAGYYILPDDLQEKAREKRIEELAEFKKPLLNFLEENGATGIKTWKNLSGIMASVPAGLVDELAKRNDVMTMYLPGLIIPLGESQSDQPPPDLETRNFVIEIQGPDETKKVNIELKLKYDQGIYSIPVPNDILSEDIKVEINGVNVPFIVDKKASAIKFPLLSESKDDKIPSPRTQLKQGIAPEEIVCKDGLELIFKPNNSPACVKPKTTVKLVERGWALDENKTQQKIDSANPVETIIKMQSYSGLCIGYCIVDVVITSEKISYSKRGSAHVFGESFTLPEITNEVSLSKTEWQRILDFVDFEKFLSLPDMIGCPGCTDAPVERIEISVGEKTKSISFEFHDNIPEIDDLRMKLNNIHKIARPSIGSFEECIDAGYEMGTVYPWQCITEKGQLFVKTSIDSFEECIDAGYKMIQTDPRRCVTEYTEFIEG